MGIQNYTKMKFRILRKNTSINYLVNLPVCNEEHGIAFGFIKEPNF